MKLMPSLSRSIRAQWLAKAALVELLSKPFVGTITQPVRFHA